MTSRWQSGRKQESREHLGDLKVGQSGLKIEWKSGCSHSNRTHSGSFKSLDVTRVPNGSAHVFLPESILTVLALLASLQCPPLLFPSEQTGSFPFSQRRVNPSCAQGPPVLPRVAPGHSERRPASSHLALPLGLMGELALLSPLPSMPYLGKSILVLLFLSLPFSRFLIDFQNSHLFCLPLSPVIHSHSEHSFSAGPRKLNNIYGPESALLGV